MKPLRERNDLQAWASDGDYTSLTSRDSIEILLSQHTGVDLGAPVDGATAVTTTPTLRWAPYPGATSYQVNVWDYTGDTKGTQIVDEIVSDTDDGDAVEYTISSALDSATKFLWQVSQRRTEAPTNPEQPISVSISGGTTLEQNGTRQLSVSVSNSTQGVTWSSSDDGVATVNSSGLVTYVSGAIDATVTITATSVEDGTKSDDQELTIVAESSYTAQDSRAGDEAFMQALWDNTQGNEFPTLASTGDLPSSPADGTIYMISGEIHRYYHTDWYNSGENGWINHGTPWKVTTGWNSGSMSLADDPVGCTIETVGGELRITEFDMQKVTMDGEQTTGNALAGYLPPEWGNLTKCKKFTIKQNHFRGEIPDTIQVGSLMEWVSFAGQMEDVEPGRNLVVGYSKLDGFDKRNEVRNLFSGALPSTLDNLTLKILEARRQAFTGTLPEITDWSEFQVILLDFIRTLDEEPSEDALSGSIPASWQPTNKMQNIEIAQPKYESNGMTSLSGYTGDIPSTFTSGMTTELESYIILARNSFTGNLPIFPVRNARRLDFGLNDFEGGFPIEYFQGDNANLWTFILEGNDKMSGAIPTNFSPPTYPTSRSNYHVISIFNIDECGFTNLPDWIEEMTGHTQVKMDAVDFNQPMPQTLMNQPKIRFLKSSSAGWTGDLLDVDFKATGPWAELRLANNNLTGGFPASWSSLVDNYGGTGNYNGNMVRMYLNGNELENEIPSWLTDITTFLQLRLQDNKFVPKDILPTYTALKNRMGDGYKIAPQKNFGDTENINLNAGQEFTYDYSGKVHASDDLQWTFRNDPISGETSASITIASVDSNDAGDYRLEISNSSLPELGTLTSNPINLTVT